MNTINILNVVKKGLCCGCGTCIALCPENALKIMIDELKGIYIPFLDEKKCIDCGICCKVCPGHEVNFKELNSEIFGKQPDNILIGNYEGCYVGHSSKEDIRYNASSGGIITQLLISALEDGIIDGVLVTKMKENKPLEPEPFIAKTKEEIIEAMGSKYCPVPLNIALKDIIESKTEEKFAMVGLPCHIHGIRKAEQLNKALKDKIIIHLGLFCGQNPNFLGTTFLIKKLKIKEKTIKSIRFRGQGWPGSMNIKFKEGNEISLSNYWSSSFGLNFFTPDRCLLCNDGLCELADISFGDPWLNEFSSEKIGKTLIITKNNTCENVIKSMKNRGMISLKPINPEKVIESQKGMLYLKKKLFTNPHEIFKNSPKYIINNNNFQSNHLDFLISLFPFINSKLYSNKYIRRFIGHLPAKILKLYGLPYNFIIHIKSKKDFKKISRKFLKNPSNP